MLRTRPRDRSLLLAFVALAISLVVFGFLPLAFVVKTAFSGGGFAEELLDPRAHEALLHSLVLGLSVCAIAVPLGAFFAWVLERTDAFEARPRARMRALLSLPMAIPPYLLGMAWLLLGNGRTGLLNRAAPVLDLYGLDGMVLVLATSTYPFVFLAVRASLVRADPSLEEAARISGARPLRVVRDVTLPLALPAIAGSAGLVFVFTLAAFGVPYLFGGSTDAPYRVLTTRIYQDLALGGALPVRRAALSAMALLSISIAAQAFTGRLAGGAGSVRVGGKTVRASRLALGRMRAPLRWGLVGFGVVFVILPIVTIAWTSFVGTFSEPGRLTLRHWVSVLGREETLRAFGHSLILAVAAGAIVAVAGVAVARGSERGGWSGRAMSALAVAPYAVPGTVLALGFVFTFAREVRFIAFERITFVLQLSVTLGILLAAYAVKHLAFGVRGAGAALAQVHPSLEEAARISGAAPLRSFRDVVFPMIAPAAAAAFLIAALASFSELTMSVLLFGAGTETTGTLLFELQSYADPPEGAVVATAIVGLAVIGDAIVRRWTA